jgi:hypothetical protein
MATEVVGIAPPLTIDRACADRIVEILAESIAAMEGDLLAAEKARAARRAAQRVDSIEALFAAMLGRFDPNHADGIDVAVRFALTGGAGGNWLLTIRDRAIRIDAAAEGIVGAAVTIRADADHYLQIANGELSGAEAFSTRRLVIEGDLAQAAVLARLGLM